MLPTYIYDLSKTIPRPCGLDFLSDFGTCNLLAFYLEVDGHNFCFKPFEFLRADSFYELEVALSGLGSLTVHTDFVLYCHVYNESVFKNVRICDTPIHVPIYIPCDTDPFEIAWIKENFSLF